VPVEIQMAGIPHLTHLRSTTLAGLSSLMLIFDDDSTSDINREHVLERLSQVNLPLTWFRRWHRLESSRPDLLVHVGEQYPAYDVMEKKSLEDWTLKRISKVSMRG